MTKVIFLFISIFFILLAIFSGGFVVNLEQQLLFALILIIVFGIPHGAIDNVIFLQQSKLSKWKFYLNYIGGVIINILSWIYFPEFAFMLFILISAYHFGQSQFSNYNFKGTQSKLLFISWGMALLLGMLSFNQLEIIEMTSQMSEFDRLSAFLSGSFLEIGFLAFFILTLFLLFRLVILKKLKIEQFLMEVFVYSLAFAGFYVFPLLVGFTLYFVVLHSIKVLNEEYLFVSHFIKRNLSLSIFIKLLIPFTLISVFGLLGIYYLSQTALIQFPFGYSLLIMISSITLPHAFVMERFYTISLPQN